MVLFCFFLGAPKASSGECDNPPTHLTTHTLPQHTNQVGKYPGRLLLAKLNVDTYQEVAMSLQVRSLPSVFGIHGGKLVDRFVGMPSEQCVVVVVCGLVGLCWAMCIYYICAWVVVCCV